MAFNPGDIVRRENHGYAVVVGKAYTVQKVDDAGGIYIINEDGVVASYDSANFSAAHAPKSGSANATQVGGNHYKATIETWDYIVAHGLGYLEGNVIKYVTRWNKKDGMQDLKKAQHYLQKLIEVTEAKP